ncbi:MAG: lysophospholipase [Turneriella sp.]|nr:lysophospholipase [Turneriella sp.]
MEHKASVLRNPLDGFELYLQTWSPSKSKPNKVILIQHGFGEHSGRYQNFANAIEKEKALVYAADARGHGKSPGKRGHVSDFGLYASDLAVLVARARSENKDLPIFLLGHSMGAVVVALTVLKPEVASELRGVIFSSGAFRPALDLVQAIKKAIGTVLAKLAPSFTVEAGLNTNLISRDPQVVEAYRNDPLVHGKISFKMGVDLFAVGEDMIRQASRITLPALVFHGDADGIAQVQGSRDFYEALGSKDKTLKIYPGFYHETLNEPYADRMQVIADIVQWINRHS